MSSFSIAPAQIVALFMTCIFYGMHLVTAGHCLNILLFHKRSQSHLGHIIALAATLSMLVIGSIDTILGLVHVLDAFAYYTGPGGAEAELGHVSSWINVVKLVDSYAQNIIGELLLIYRCYVIHNRQLFPIALPSFLWLGYVAVSILSIYVTASRHGLGSISSNQTPFITATLVVTLVQNIMTTGMIVYTLWSHERRTSHVLTDSSTRHRINRVISIVVESALLYTVFTFLTLVTFLTNNNADYALSDCVVQIVGISFNLIIIRGHGTLSSGWTKHDQEPTSFQRSQQSNVRSYRLSNLSGSEGRRPSAWKVSVSDASNWPEPVTTLQVGVKE